MTYFFRLFTLIALTLFVSCSKGDSPIIDTGASSTNTAPKGFAKLHIFTPNAHGANPNGALISDGGVLYGTTASGGAGGQGTIFKIDPDGSDFTL